jgi:hypothetical protein
VDALALRSEDHDELDRLVDYAEPVRCPGAELDGLTWFDREIVVAEQEPKPPVEHVHPLVALVHGQLGGRRAPLSGDAGLVGEQAPAGAPVRERPVGDAVGPERFAADSGIGPRRRAEQVVGGDVEGGGEPRDVVEGQATLAGLEAAEGGDVDVRPLGDLLEGQLALGAQLAQPSADLGVDRIVCVVCLST